MRRVYDSRKSVIVTNNIPKDLKESNDNAFNYMLMFTLGFMMGLGMMWIFIITIR